MNQHQLFNTIITKYNKLFDVLKINIIYNYINEIGIKLGVLS